LGIVSDVSKEVYLALDGEEILGFIIINMHGAFTGYIQTLAVKPEHRGRGVGSKLISFVEKRIFKESPNVFICASSFNERAQNLYKKLGYSVVGELKDYVIAGHSEILLRKTICSRNEFRAGIAQSLSSSKPS
jgi:ribosomal protein S18 acetylase RimI-like enzyme